MTNNSLREEMRKQFEEQFPCGLGVWKEPSYEEPYYDDKTEQVLEFIESELSKARQQERESTVQQCFLECLAVECGEGECARAIRTKFPEFITPYIPKN